MSRVGLCHLVCALLLMAVVGDVRTANGQGRPTGALQVLVARRFPTDNISLADLKATFRGRRVHLAGQRLIPVNHPVGSRLRVAFDRRVLGLGPAEVGRYWIDRRIRDDGVPPKTTPTAELAVRVVAALPQAITYGTADMLNPAVKALTIDGKAPTEPGYALAR